MAIFLMLHRAAIALGACAYVYWTHTAVLANHKPNFYFEPKVGVMGVFCSLYAYNTAIASFAVA